MKWPSFIFPFGAWFLLALIPLIILYFLKLRRPRWKFRHWLCGRSW